MLTVEDLKVIAADLYKEAEEDSPILGQTGKKEWMARRIDECIDAGGSCLNDLLRYEYSQEVEDYLERQYDDRNDENLADEVGVVVTDADTTEAVVTDRWADRGTEILTGEENIPVERTEKNIKNDYQEIDREGGRVLLNDDSNALRDEYMNERPEQPEYISDEPEFQPGINRDPDYLDENAIIEEDILVVGDATDGRQRPKGQCGCKK